MLSSTHNDNDNDINNMTTHESSSSPVQSDVFARLLNSAPPYRTNIPHNYPTTSNTTHPPPPSLPFPLKSLASLTLRSQLALSSSETYPISDQNSESEQSQTPTPTPTPTPSTPTTSATPTPGMTKSAAGGHLSKDVSRLRNVALSSSEPSSVHGFQRLAISKKPELPNDSVRQILREIREMNKENFDNHQISVTMKGDDPRHLIVTLTPDDGLYADGHYEISMTLPDNYPLSKPKFQCNTPIFHPNIAYDGGICFSLLEENDPSLRLADYVHGLLWLMYYPNLYSRVNMDCPRDGKVFSDMVRVSIEGGVVCGRVYERSVRLPKKEEEKEEERESVCCENMRLLKKGKKWEWKLIEKEWVQVFIEECQCAAAASCV
jgi:ubiquitin-protein ligase